jgi:pimeloyl-ACP methyl ester carboxylesterase
MYPSFERMSAFARVIVFDKRGTGSSDPVDGAPSLEERMDDVRAVMEATKSSCAALLGVADGGAMSLLFAATYPERTFALALFRAKPRYVWAPDFPWAPTHDEYERKTADLLEERLLPDGEAYERRSDRLTIVSHGRRPLDFDEFREQSRIARLTASPGTSWPCAAVVDVCGRHRRTRRRSPRRDRAVRHREIGSDGTRPPSGAESALDRRLTLAGQTLDSTHSGIAASTST